MSLTINDIPCGARVAVFQGHPPFEPSGEKTVFNDICQQKTLDLILPRLGATTIRVRHPHSDLRFERVINIGERSVVVSVK